MSANDSAGQASSTDTNIDLQVDHSYITTTKLDTIDSPPECFKNFRTYGPESTGL